MTTKTTTVVNISTTSLTRADHDPGPGWPDAIRVLKIDAEGQERHASRVRRAESILACEKLPAENLTDPQVPLGLDEVLAMRAIAAMEVGGLGGPHGIAGGATCRMSIFRGCGKGRKNATDGEAWDAAIIQVFASVTGDCGNRLGTIEAWNVLPTHVAQAVHAYITGGEDGLGDLEWAATYAVRRSVAAMTASESVAWWEVAVAAIVESPGGSSAFTGHGWRDALVAAAGAPGAKSAYDITLPATETTATGVMEGGKVAPTITMQGRGQTTLDAA